MTIGPFLDCFWHGPGTLTGQQELGFEHGFVGKLSRSIWQSKFQLMPEILQADVAFPILTVGNNGTGTSMHQHEGTWLLLMTGVKTWWIADGTTRTKSFGQRDPCQNLGADLSDLPGLQFCVQKPGELLCLDSLDILKDVWSSCKTLSGFCGRNPLLIFALLRIVVRYFPDDSYHATCNMDTFVWGLGSQSSNHDWPALVTAASLGHLSVVGKKLKKNSKQKKMSRATYAAALQRALGFGHHVVAEKLPSWM